MPVPCLPQLEEEKRRRKEEAARKKQEQEVPYRMGFPRAPALAAPHPLPARCFGAPCSGGVQRVCVPHFQAAKLAKMKTPPREMFLSESDKYSKFDENVSARPRAGEGVMAVRGP